MRRILILFFLLFPMFIYSFSSGFVSMRSHQFLESKMFISTIQHRFYGAISDDPIDSLLGMDDGANIGLGITVGLTSQLSLRLDRYRQLKEYTYGIQYRLPRTPLFDVMLGAYGISEKIQKNRLYGSYGLIALHTKQAFMNTHVLSNLVFDSLTQRLGVSYGLDTRLTDSLSLIGELAPSTDQAKDLSALFGLRYATFGHRFFVTIQNTQELGPRRFLHGTANKDWCFGFQIERLLDGSVYE